MSKAEGFAPVGGSEGFANAYSWLAETANAYNPFSPPDSPQQKPMNTVRDRSRSRSAPRPARSPPGANIGRTGSFGDGGANGAKSRRRRSLNRPVPTFDVMSEDKLEAMRTELEARGLLVEVRNSRREIFPFHVTHDPACCCQTGE